MCSVLFSYAVVKVRAIPIRLLFRHIGMVDVILTQLPMNVNPLFYLVFPCACMLFCMV